MVGDTYESILMDAGLGVMVVVVVMMKRRKKRGRKREEGFERSLCELAGAWP